MYCFTLVNKIYLLTDARKARRIGSGNELLIMVLCKGNVLGLSGKAIVCFAL